MGDIPAAAESARRRTGGTRSAAPAGRGAARRAVRGAGERHSAGVVCTGTVRRRVNSLVCDGDSPVPAAVSQDWTVRGTDAC